MILKAVFMGTPDFAVPCLKAMLDEGIEVAAVVTQPDKPKGRGKKLAMPPVKELAIENGIQVYQPKRVKDGEFVEILKEINPDIIVVVAFGQILSKEILSIPKYGCINVHGSLLPKYRGAAPVNWAIINGEKKTGITTMYMDEGLDTGDMILKSEVEIGDDETAGELYHRLSSLGAQVLKDTIGAISKGNAPREKQDDSISTYAHMMDKKLGAIDWKKQPHEIVNLVRGTNPWPGAYTGYNGNTMKIWEVAEYDSCTGDSEPGRITSVSDDGIVVSCANGCIIVKEIQMPNKKRMKVSEYLKGNEIEKGVSLGA
ncbi:methionyl-tRNA formyltransferase [Peptoclostridium litorale DSM 5388]|uniref:Methionyl-tRNA formyltransferase n=1 Tax=Peptoclostridium litorale DSM 5388 TaxID=1121324 RepID=A0A069RAD2_PEPLI|nr:methionyl-tRNA formyltransferase Fmt [Peptoclostridium litorale DSM 5388]SIN79853.1 methionyl-tRNA formyltransferase [Peptoclostridium litorale DSM 5388]